MEKLTLKVLGTLELFVSENSASAEFRSDKVRALLVYLALEAGRPHQRRSLASLLWPDFPESTALRNLRKGLYYLRQTIDHLAPQASDLMLLIDRQTVLLNLHKMTVDAVQFDYLLSAVEQHAHRHLHLCRECLEKLAEAVTLYQGELLAGFSLRDAAAFEEWLLFWRERLHLQAISVLDRLTTAYMERGENEQALTYATHQVALDRFREPAYRQMMRLLTLDGQHSKALAVFESCRTILHNELGVEPSHETVELYRQIQAAQRGDAVVRVIHKPAALHYFPVQFTPFIGRDAELQQIEEQFLDPECRLLTLVGAAGMGKTRLAIRAGEMLAGKGGFGDGIYFFSLAAIQNRHSLLTALISGLGVTLSERTNPQERLLDYLHERQCLLVLDNFEQLLDSAPLLVEMLTAAPGLRLLVTSHIPLQLRAEHLLFVSGLSYPAVDEAAPNLAAFSAVQLFLESARHADASFRLHPANEDAVRQICWMVRGMPLALELASAWVNMMDCATIVREIGHSLDFLSLSPRDRPDRHQSLVAVFAYSWQLLASTEQTALGQLAVFRGPFSLEAAIAITDTTPLALARLLDKSLLQRSKDGRYELHEMLRQFIRQQAGGQDKTVAERHSDYYLHLVADLESAFYGPQPRQAVAALQPQLDNIRQAWQWAVTHDHWPAVARSLEGLGRFYLVAALLQEGEVMFALPVTRIQSEEHLVTELERGSSFLVWHAYFLNKLGRHAEAVAQAQKACEHAGHNEAARAEVHSLLGELLPVVGKFDQALMHLEQAITYYRRTTNLVQLARTLQRRAVACFRSGDRDEALRSTQEAIPLFQALEYKQGQAQMNNVLAGINYELDNLTQSLTYIQLAQELYEQIGNKLDVAVVSANQDSIYRRLGRFEEALTANQRAIDISQELGDRPGLSRDLSNRGLILATIGEFDRSLDNYYRALEIEKTLSNEVRIAYYQAGIATVYQLKGDEETAMNYYDLALPVLLAQATPYHQVDPLLSKAELQFQRHEWVAARGLNEQALALAEELVLPEYIQRSRVLAAKLAFVAGEKVTAQQQLADLLAKTDDEMEQAALNFELWQLTGDKAPAEAALTGYQQAYNRVPSFVNKKRLTELQSVLVLKQ